VIHRHLSRIAAGRPDQLALIDGDLVLGYGELLARSAAFARLLRERFEIRADDVVAAALPNCWQLPVGFLATVALGARFVPCNPQWRASEITQIVRRLGIRLAITCRQTTAAWSGGETLPLTRLLEVDADGMEDVWLGAGREGFTDGGIDGDEERIALLLATSGSTGRSKIVPRSHRNLLAGAEAVGAALGIAEGDRLLGVVPFHHANGFANTLWLPLARGATSVIARQALPATLIELIHRQRVRVVNMSPLLYSLLAEHPLAPGALSSVEIFLSSGAALPRPLAEAWRARSGRPIRQLYGSSETGTLAIEEEEAPQTLPGAVGRPLATVSVRILDPTGTSLPCGRTGEIAVRGPAMMSGYFDDPELDREAFVDGHFRIGDLGRLTPEGDLVLEGRATRWINAGGVKVDPVEVENVLGRLAGVGYCRVLPGRNRRGIEVLRALIRPRVGAALSLREVVAHCRDHLAEYKIPRVIEFVDEMPGDAAGKMREEQPIP
jgi:long-chain acyl-CoA synthetase